MPLPAVTNVDKSIIPLILLFLISIPFKMLPFNPFCTESKLLLAADKVVNLLKSGIVPVIWLLLMDRVTKLAGNLPEIGPVRRLLDKFNSVNFVNLVKLGTMPVMLFTCKPKYVIVAGKRAVLIEPLSPKLFKSK
eukprot:NODE_770_length_4034_cov_0.751207.p2 type:complete len:135 gc:universal NODE_770_length_4034_cov_0.751207:2691-3095(+)